MTEEKFRRTLVTAALPYANGPVHIGHLAGVYLPADVYVRFKKLTGQPVLFVCGSDEHGVPVTIRAQKEGIPVQEAVDKYHQMIQQSFEGFGIQFDIYSRTSNKTHHQTASGFFKKLLDEGKFLEKTSEQFYDATAGQFLADRYIQGTCPKCGFENAYGDQCENCGSTLSPSELIQPRSMLSGHAPVLKETRHWYLPLDQYEPWLREWILQQHKDWKPNVYGQCKSWIDQGLQPRAVTRDLDWGVKLPIPGTEGKVLYVWFDAPIGYISATQEWAEREGANWETWWKDETTRLIHFIGKDNIVFHCIIFPTMLHAHGDYIIPDQVPANEFLNLEGQKISTSRNWAVWLHEYLEDLPDQQDALRYALLTTAPETKDNDFTWKEFQARCNNELADILGNFVNRALVLTHKYFEGKVPPTGLFQPEDQEFLRTIRETPGLIRAGIEEFKFRQSVSDWMNLARAGNKYLADTEPWKLIKKNPERVGTILYLALQACGALTQGMQVFLPFSGEKLKQMLPQGLPDWQENGTEKWFEAGESLGQPQILFTKIQDEVIAAQLEKLEQKKLENKADKPELPPLKEPIQFDHFGKLDLRVATIIAAEPVKKTKKLLKLTLDTGIDQRTVVSGIAEFYEAEKIIGQRVVLLANLAPREIKGIESEGMILMAQNPDGQLSFVEPKEVPIINGASIS